MSLFSIVVPVFNEEGNVYEFHRQLAEAMSPYDYEVIFVDDGSTDRTASIIESFGNPRVSVLNFIRNRGHQNALDAGYRAAKGDFVVSMDGDLQHPIDVLISMIELSSRESIDVIYAVRAKRVEDALLKRLSAKFYYFFS